MIVRLRAVEAVCLLKPSFKAASPSLRSCRFAVSRIVFVEAALPGLRSGCLSVYVPVGRRSYAEMWVVFLSRKVVSRVVGLSPSRGRTPWIVVVRLRGYRGTSTEGREIYAPRLYSMQWDLSCLQRSSILCPDLGIFAELRAHNLWKQMYCY